MDGSAKNQDLHQAAVGVAVMPPNFGGDIEMNGMPMVKAPD